MTDREVIEECYRLVAPLKDGRRERQIKRLLKWHLGEDAVRQLEEEARGQQS